MKWTSSQHRGGDPNPGDGTTDPTPPVSTPEFTVSPDSPLPFLGIDAVTLENRLAHSVSVRNLDNAILFLKARH